ncbi:MFS transporter [Limosilactobacillus sp. STM2_1]|uniref:MFS transporter n=1 Tax=Limosilactobacillus rudii TaxID=2759755 RepID=A0A7W3UM34_9LACO|nr:MFS transporter [Limosilactobacillus rudii]MBB1079922.1 MFS transporter [Limosilactobacillus rudii]MBB1098001.1 MFS transporter [Limosilactobacillus rudii]MCD7135070.1 MFS transporter [Limosilactobacillus rudii]
MNNDHSSQSVIHDGWDEYKNRKIYQKRGKIGIWRSIGFGTFSFFSISMQGLVGAWLLFFYTTFCGLSAGQGATIFLIGRVADAIASLFMGNISDNIYKYKLGRKYGRRHIFILAAIPSVLVPITLWIAGMSYWYYLITYLITTILMSILQIPWETLPNEMTKDFNERTYLSTTRMVIAGLGGMLTQFIPAMLFKFYPKTSPEPYFIMQVIFSVVTVFLIWICYKTTWEHFVTKAEAKRLAAEAKEQNGGNGSSLKAELKNYFSTFKIKTFRIHMGIYLSSYFASVLFSTVFVYYIVYVLGKSTSTSGFLQSLSIISVPVTIIAGIVITKVSYRAMDLFGYSLILISAIMWGIIAMIKPGHMMVYLVIGMVLYEIGLYILYFTPWNAFPFIPDLDTLVTGKNRSGLFASVMVFINQISQGLAGVVAGYLLDFAGFKKSATGALAQPHSAILMITLIMSVGVGGFILLAMFFASRFHLSKKSFKVLSTELVRLQKGGSMKDVDPHTKAVCEDLTGVKYDSITYWKKND